MQVEIHYHIEAERPAVEPVAVFAIQCYAESLPEIRIRDGPATAEGHTDAHSANTRANTGGAIKRPDNKNNTAGRADT